MLQILNIHFVKLVLPVHPSPAEKINDKQNHCHDVPHQKGHHQNKNILHDTLTNCCYVQNSDQRYDKT